MTRESCLVYLTKMRQRFFIVALSVVLGLFFVNPLHVSADNRVINDLSWPNCGEKIANLSPSGIVGVTGGLGFSPNPCLNAETQLFHNSYSLYINTGFPGLPYDKRFTDYPNKCNPTNDICMAYNYGYNSALYSIRYASSQDAHTFMWWLDVESVNSWSSNYQVNRQALRGMIAAIKANALLPKIGFYFYPGQWESLTNAWENNYPAWLATGTSSKPFAKAFCSLSFNGGKTLLSQYTTKLDDNYVCQGNIVDDFKI